MNSPSRPVLLIAEDNPDDRLLLQYAWSRKSDIQLFFVEDGEEVIDFMRHEGSYAQAERVPYPNLILLDLRMPRKNGFEVLETLKSHPVWRSIPVVIFTTSEALSDAQRVYQLGANSYLVKPQTVQEILGITDSLYQRWF
jgi:CheY-like chemotaxis protein